MRGCVCVRFFRLFDCVLVGVFLFVADVCVFVCDVCLRLCCAAVVCCLSVGVFVFVVCCVF